MISAFLTQTTPHQYSRVAYKVNQFSSLGSTNAVLHFLAIAKSLGIKLSIDDFQKTSDRIPFLADLKPR